VPLPVYFHGWHGDNVLITKIIKVITITKLIIATTQVTLSSQSIIILPIKRFGMPLYSHTVILIYAENFGLWPVAGECRHTGCLIIPYQLLNVAIKYIGLSVLSAGSKGLKLIRY
jgi:hypothetical protein